MTGWPQEVRPCLPDERRAALGVLYRRMPEPLRPRLIDDALAEERRGGVDLSGLWVAVRRGQVIGALLSQVLAGNSAGIWAPEVNATWGRSATAQALVRSALADLQSRGIRIVQALLDESSPRQAAADLIAGGLPRVTDLVYLEIDTSRRVLIHPGVPKIDWRPFCEETDAEFRAVIEEAYHESLDMPELEGFRSLDDIIAGHRAGGRFVPDRWRLGRVAGQPGIGAVVLLSELHDRNAWEIAYLGLSREARGKGLGMATLAHAFDLARPHVSRIELAVDIRNTPANRLYRAAGFRAYDRREVFLTKLD